MIERKKEDAVGKVEQLRREVGITLSIEQTHKIQLARKCV